MGIDPRILKALERKLSFTKPTLVQQHFIPLALTGRDILARSRTGSGKTIAYAVPLVHHVLADKEAAAVAPTAANGVRALVLVPTHELADQTTTVLESVAFYAFKLVRIRNLSFNAAATKAATSCDVIVGTPGRVAELLKSEELSLAMLKVVVLDEADLLLSYGHDAALQEVAAKLPRSCQGMLLSATLSAEVDKLKSLVLHSPALLRLEDDEADAEETESSAIGEFCVRVASDSDRFLIAYALLKLKVIPGKTLVFLNAVDRCFRLKLFLDKFGVRAAVLNAALPLNSRLHTIEEFNRGVFGFLLATDDGDFSRGLDYKRVAAVLNFDLPPTADAYVHRIGRTGRAGGSGTAVTLVDASDGKTAELEASVAVFAGREVKPYELRRTVVEGLRYRCEDVLRSISRKQVKEAQEDELRAEVLNSARLAEHFSANPREAGLLKGELQHDRKLLRKAAPAHLRAIPGYLLPAELGLGGGVDPDGAPIVAPPPSKRRLRHQRHAGARIGSYNVLATDPQDVVRDAEASTDHRTGKRRKLDLDPTADEILPQSSRGRSHRGRGRGRGRGGRH